MRNFYLRRFLAVATIATGTLSALSSVAAPFKPGNIVVARVGDGSAALSTAAAAVFLDEYTPAGRLVQSIALPTSVGSTNRILTASGTSTAELSVTRSADGRYLVLTGYGAVPGTSGVASTASADVARVIALVSADGTVDTRTSTGDVFDGVGIWGAATTDGTSFYSVGSDNGIHYQAYAGTADVLLSSDPYTARSINVASGNIYISSDTRPNAGISQVGTGLPTTAGQSVTSLPGFPGSTAGSSPFAFFFADLSPAVPGVDVVYVADERSSVGIQKWSLVNNTWTLNGSIAGSSTTAVRGLNGSVAGTTVSLAASSNNSLFVMADNAGYNVAPSIAALPTVVATSPTNTAFRGVAFAPVALAPTITSFTPATGQAGATVTITGTNLTGATSVSIGSLAVTTFTVVSATSITLTVPASTAAVSGPITVVTPGGTATSTSSFNLVLATQANQAMPGLSIYPNPATDYVRIKLPRAGAATAALRDLTGRLVVAPMAIEAEQNLALPGSLPSGTYLLEIQQGTVKAVRRIQKQ